MARMNKGLVAFAAFSLLCGGLYFAAKANGPGPVPFVPTFGSGPPSTPPNAPNQTYSDTASNFATYLYQSSAATWRKISTGGSGGGSTTWPASGSAVISNSTNSPIGIAEIDNKVLVGSAGAWIAGNVPLATITGGICNSTANAVQYNNGGVMGCAPLTDNAGIMDFTGSAWQVGAGVSFFKIFNTDDIAFGKGALANYTAGNLGMVCIGSAACGNVTSAAGGYTAVGYQSCGDGGASGSSANVCVGFQAGKAMAGSQGNDTYIGTQSGFNTSTSGDACVGAFTCENSGGSNAVLGFQAGISLSGGQDNSLLGYEAGFTITGGAFDVCIGSFSCPALTTGTRDIFIIAGQVSDKCAMSSATVNDEFDLCSNGTSAGDSVPLIRCNITSIAAGNCKFNVPDADPGYTVATLPAAPPTGSRAYVTDAVACTFLATPTGGSTVFCPVIWNGSAWIAG